MLPSAEHPASDAPCMVGRRWWGALDILWGYPARSAFAQNDGRGSRRARHQQVADLVLVDLDVAHLRAWHTALTQRTGTHAISNTLSILHGAGQLAAPSAGRLAASSNL